MCLEMFSLHCVFICYWLLLLSVQLFAIRMWSFLFLHGTCLLLLPFSVPFNSLLVPIPSTSASTAKHYIWFQLAVCGVECPISNFQGSVQREWCTRLSSHCAHHITTVSQHLSTAAKYSVQHCSGSHTHCATGQGQQLSDQGIHYTTWWAGGCACKE